MLDWKIELNMSGSRFKTRAEDAKYFEPDQIVFTGRYRDIRTLIGNLNTPASGFQDRIFRNEDADDSDAEPVPLWSFRPGGQVGDPDDDDIVIQLYQFTPPAGGEVTVWRVIRAACRLAINNPGRPLSVIPEPHALLTSLPHEGGGGVVGGPTGKPQFVDGRGGLPDDKFFHRQWAFGPYPGIDLYNQSDPANPTLMTSTNTGNNVVVAIFDSTPIGTGEYGPGTAHDGTEGYPFRLYVDAALSAAHGTVPAKRDDYAEHGFSVASLVNAVAPDAKLQLIQVLDDHVLGGTCFLLDVINKYLTKFRRTDETAALIINLSLGYGLTTVPDLSWLGPEGSEARAAFGDMGDLAQILRRNHQGAGFLGAGRRRVIALAGYSGFLERYSLPYFLNCIRSGFEDLDFLIVAAAGNRSNGNSDRYAPTEPASYEGVLGVAASGHEGLISYYANRDDVKAPGGDYLIRDRNAIERRASISNDRFDENGRSTRGTGSTLERNLEILTAEPGLDCRHAVVARATRIAPTHPEHADPANADRSAFMYWLGSSFAAPLVSGLAARLWENNPTEPAQRIARRIEDSMHRGIINVEEALRH